MARARKTRVFVSYSRHDEALVRPLAGLLGVAAGDAVFLEVSSLKPGDLWDEKILGAVKEASVFVLCRCCACESSSFVAKEIGAALWTGGKKLVPVLFCSAPLPPSMARPAVERPAREGRARVPRTVQEEGFLAVQDQSREEPSGDP